MCPSYAPTIVCTDSSYFSIRINVSLVKRIGHQPKPPVVNCELRGFQDEIRQFAYAHSDDTMDQRGIHLHVMY